MADRARALAELTGDATSRAVSAREMAVATRQAGYFDDASRLLTTTADSLSTSDPEGLAARGCLLLTAAYTQAKNGNSSDASDLIADARCIAGHLPKQQPAMSIFDPTQVPVYAVSIHNALGNFSRALVAARSGLRTLQKLEHLAPEDARRPSVRLVVGQLLERPGPQPVGLTAFARRNGAFR